MNPKPIALLCSDLHLQLECPVARDEPSWKEVMSRSLNELSVLANRYACPIICAGDIFNHWKAPPELINFALAQLPEMYAVPGQHDLPLHNYEDLHKSAYETLVRADKIHTLVPGVPCQVPTHGSPGLVLHGFPWGYPPKPRGPQKAGFINVAVVHSYIWKSGCGFPGAQVGELIAAYHPSLVGYDVALFGDNHHPFLQQLGSCLVFNHGAFFLRKSDERRLKPEVGVLMSDGSIHLRSLDSTPPNWFPEPEAHEQENQRTMDELVRELQELGATGLDFTEAVKTYLQSHRVPEDVQKVILHLLDDGT